MTLAVRDDFLINRQPFCSQVLFGVRTNTQPIFVIHQLGPLTMDGARNVARLRSRRPFAAIFGCAACVPNSAVAVSYLSHYVSYLNLFIGIDADVWLIWRDFGSLVGQWHVGIFPRLQTAVQIGILLVTDGIQSPDKTTRPTAALVVVHHKMGFRRVTQK